MLIVKFFETIVPILMCIRLVNGCSTYEYRDFFTRGCHTVRTLGYHYDEFFPLMTKQNHTDFWLPFYVKTKQDAHVVVSTTPSMPCKSILKGYEIVFGAHKNHYTAIRRSPQGLDESTTPGNEVSSEEWRRFWIKVTKSGLLSIGGRTNCSEFLKWTDPEPLPVKYFSFASYPGIFGSWAFNCTRQNDLEWYLFIKSKYDQKIVPRNLARIPLTITSQSIDLDESKGIFKLNGTATMVWKDERLIWEPNNFSQIHNFTIEDQFVTWTPNVKLANIGTYYTEIFGCGNTSMWNNGTISWNPSVHIKTNCTIDSKLWPFDSQTCQINFTTSEELNFRMNYGDLGTYIRIIGLQITNLDGAAMTHVEYPKITPTWTINGTRVLRLIASNETETSNYQYLWSVEITLTRNLSRNHYFLLIAFMTCSLAWFLLLLITTTWFKPIKIVMNSALLLIITTIIMILVDCIPQFPRQIPYLFIGYTTLFVFCALSNTYSAVSSVCHWKTQKKDVPSPENN